ncbi:UDP-galactopyranose mutase [Meridianimaribacter sp. CL38]|nr:UDP-galactopyranose mutase [Meridianimaribacter sp. CL38]
MLCAKHDVKVFEKSNQIGGLIKCTRESGNLFHRVGGHVFNSKNDEVLDWFWSFFDKDEFVGAVRNAKIYLGNKYLDYPIENNLYKLDKEQVDQIIKELLEVDKRVTEYKNFEDFLKGNFGDTLYELYFGPYNKKVWNTDLKSIPLDWLEGKLPMPNLIEILSNNILKQKETNMVHASFYYPKNNGSQFIVDRLSEKLDIETGINIDDIKKHKSGWLVNNTYFDCVIYTGNIRYLKPVLQNVEESVYDVLEATKQFKYNGTSNVLCYTESNDISWLYFPEASIIPHRIIYTGNFSESNNEGIRKTCVVEFSGEHTEAVIEEELKKMPGNLEPIAFNYEPYSYVINSFDTRAVVNTIKEKLEENNMFLLGRFAEWEYYNMDKCIEAAFKLVEKINE